MSSAISCSETSFLRAVTLSRKCFAMVGFHCEKTLLQLTVELSFIVFHWITDPFNASGALQSTWPIQRELPCVNQTQKVNAM